MKGFLAFLTLTRKHLVTSISLNWKKICTKEAITIEPKLTVEELQYGSFCIIFLHEKVVFTAFERHVVDRTCQYYQSCDEQALTQDHFPR
jgi:hypothetical protein